MIKTLTRSFPVFCAAGLHCKLLRNENDVEKVRLDELFRQATKCLESKEPLLPVVDALQKIIHKRPDLKDQALDNVHRLFIKAQKRSFVEEGISHLVHRTTPSSLAYSEQEELTSLEAFFPFLNTHLAAEEQEERNIDLKILCANLPCSKDRASYETLLLNEGQQRDILCSRLQKREDELVNMLIYALLQGSCALTEKDESRLVKLLAEPSPKESFGVSARLSESNKNKLQRALESYRQKERGLVHNLLLSFALFEEDKKDLISRESLVKVIKRTAKCKTLFEEGGKIPFWYHATQGVSIETILRSKEILVMFKGAGEGSKGAWVSTKEESFFFGRSIVALSGDLIELDPYPQVVHRFPDRRWRGLLHSIPIQRYLVCCSVYGHDNKDTQRADKKKLSILLQEEGYPETYKLFSSKQLAFLQRQVTSILGMPNLPSSYWSR